MAVIFHLSCILLPVLFNIIIKAFMNEIDEMKRFNAIMDKLGSATHNEEDMKDQKPFGVYKKNQTYKCPQCSAIFIDSDDTRRCPCCNHLFMYDKPIPISTFWYKWLRYWRSRQ